MSEVVWSDDSNWFHEFSCTWNCGCGGLLVHDIFFFWRERGDVFKMVCGGARQVNLLHVIAWCVKSVERAVAVRRGTGDRHWCSCYVWTCKFCFQIYYYAMVICWTWEFYQYQFALCRIELQGLLFNDVVLIWKVTWRRVWVLQVGDVGRVNLLHVPTWSLKFVGRAPAVFVEVVIVSGASSTPERGKFWFWMCS